MIKNIVSTADLFEVEPSLVDFVRQDMNDYSQFINQAFRIVLMDLRNKGYDLRLLNTPLVLHPMRKETEAGDTDSSEIDYINRNLLTITTTALDGVQQMRLQGRDNSSDSWTDIGDVVTITEVGNINVVLTEFYKYYKLKWLYTIDNTFEAYLSENVYYYMIMYKALNLIYNSLRRLKNTTVFEDKTEEYQVMYEKLLDGALFSYDKDSSKSIDIKESTQDLRTIRIQL